MLFVVVAWLHGVLWLWWGAFIFSSDMTENDFRVSCMSPRQNELQAPDARIFPTKPHNNAQAKGLSSGHKRQQAIIAVQDIFRTLLRKKVNHTWIDNIDKKGMCISRNSITPRTMSPTVAAGQTKSSRKRPKNRTEFASSLAAEAFLTQRPELIRSAHLLLRATRELDECERAKASGGTISVQSRFLRDSNNDPNITEQERTELLRQLYQDGRQSRSDSSKRDDARVAADVGLGSASIAVDIERVQDDSHLNHHNDAEEHKDVDRPSSPASSIGKKRKIHEISDKAWRGHDSRHRKKAKRGDSKMHSVASRTA